MTELEKGIFITELKERLNAQDALITIETDNTFNCKIFIEWVSMRGYHLL